MLNEVLKLNASSKFPSATCYEDAPALAGRVRRRVLVSAFAISPDRGSEPAVGWNLCRRLARHHDVTVLTSAGIEGEQRGEIARYFATHGPIPGLTFHEVDTPLSRRLCRFSGPVRSLFYVGYSSWQRAALKEARRLHAARPFDLVHHLTFTGYREPGRLWQLGIPFFWGPIGGAENVPRAFFPLLGRRDRLLYGVRNLFNGWQMRSASPAGRAAVAARHIWACSEETRRMVADRWGCSASILPETGATRRTEAAVRSFDGIRPLRLVWSGQHVGRKALPILLRAMAALEGQNRVELLVLGNGHETSRWQALATELGLDKQVRWAGQLTHARAVAEMGDADALAFTGLKEGTPHVVLEAMSLGLPVICHDSCGMGVVVNETCGIKIAQESPEASIGGFARAIERLNEHPAEVRRLSEGALRRAAELDWDETARRMAATYDEVLAAEPVAQAAVREPSHQGMGDRPMLASSIP